MNHPSFRAGAKIKIKTVNSCISCLKTLERNNISVETIGVIARQNADEPKLYDIDFIDKEGTTRNLTGICADALELVKGIDLNKKVEWE